MEPHEIRAELIRNRVKVIDIAKQCNVKHPNVCRVIANKRPTKHIREAIASAIKMTVSDVWPDEAGEGKE